jgi:hypothetical protein
MTAQTCSSWTPCFHRITHQAPLGTQVGQSTLTRQGFEFSCFVLLWHMAVQQLTSAATLSASKATAWQMLAGKLACLQALLRSVSAFSADRVVVVSNSTAALDLAGKLCR